MNPIKKLFVLTLILSFSLVRISFAQEAVADAPASAPAASSSEGSIVDVPLEDLSVVVSGTSTAPVPEPAAPAVPQTATADIVQDTFNVQQGATSTVLENTSNPEVATSSDAQTVPITGDAATSTVPVASTDSTTTTETTTGDITITDTPLLDVVDSNLADTTAVAQGDTPTDTTLTVEPLATIPLVGADAAPGPEFEFAITGKNIPTKDSSDKTVTTALTPTVDNASGTMEVSGKCSSAYYVVLLFKNADDYKNDPRSYIVNKAYPCTGGAFTYSIADLPEGLESGVYYLMIGEQAEKGPWTPITALTEITIKKN